MTTTRNHRSDVSSVLDAAETLTGAGRHAEAVELLVRATRSSRDPELLRRLVQVRHEAFAPPPEPTEGFMAPRAVEGAPAGTLSPIQSGELTVERLRRGLSEHGCVWVRGLIPEARARSLAEGIDRALAAFDAAEEADVDHGPGGEEAWFSQFTPRPGSYRTGGRRRWVRASGAMWTADSPEMLDRLIQLIDETGIGAVVTEYFGERPALSANKCTMRRVPLDTNVGWHQDGAFLGAEVRALNMWLALGDCGRDAPGIDVVPRRLDHLVASGTDGAMFDWSVAPDVVRSEAGEVEIVRPEFAAGDALLFDHLFLHSTAVDPSMVRERHALETWMFAPSAYPEGQIPLSY